VGVLGLHLRGQTVTRLALFLALQQRSMPLLLRIIDKDFSRSARE
jgi:hypothetical protein